EQLFAALAAALKAKGFTRFMWPEGKRRALWRRPWGLRRSMEQLFAALAAALKAKGFTRFMWPEGKRRALWRR
ncbi:hypothetical protein CPF13_28260, partial [Klebsiella pneumoniae]